MMKCGECNSIHPINKKCKGKRQKKHKLDSKTQKSKHKRGKPNKKDTA